MAEALKSFATTPFDIAVTPAPEPLSFSAQISEILKEAGWKRVAPSASIVLSSGENRSKIFVSQFPLAIEISLSKKDEWMGALVALHNALRAAGFENRANIATDNSAEENAIHIYVGIKQ
jgi:hypothetical protein